jgi:hypothetical protein
MENELITSSCKCPKCKGLIVDDVVLCEASYWMAVLRCINCGWVKLQEKVSYANQTKDRRTNRMDELELYRTRRRDSKCNSDSVQYQ